MKIRETAMAGQLESLDSDEGLAKRRHRHWFDRLVMLSDGVFAIAITLLAAEIVPPTAPVAGLASLWAALVPQLDTYGLSVVVIGVFWLAHRRFMAMILTVDAPVTVITLVVLGLVALLPAFTRLADAQHGSRDSMAIYGALVVSIGAALALMWAWAALIADLVSKEVPQAERWFFFVLILFTPPFFLILTTLLGHPRPGEVPLTLMALFIVGWRMRLWVLKRLDGMAAPKRDAAELSRPKGDSP